MSEYPVVRHFLRMFFALWGETPSILRGEATVRGVRIRVD